MNCAIATGGQVVRIAHVSRAYDEYAIIFDHKRHQGRDLHCLDVVICPQLGHWIRHQIVFKWLPVKGAQPMGSHACPPFLIHHFLEVGNQKIGQIERYMVSHTLQGRSLHAAMEGYL